MNYAANVAGAANQQYPVGGASCGVGGAYNNVGAILVLFILLVIISCSFRFY
ncbi:hypothetical protein M6D81_22480 [Paenibacillus sp. J5C_2022]|uniref:hypothetical protein n=1 Tax=Paenibacillus sp. J5C2022 TaxID=2977129 RepID=UPI0021D144DC|nr:hypothetical protein [Paenibacillus sp. J5C2022]MCU6711467.1 hypothetical protein [Paenibacillus sp. J5C2022]